MSARSELFTSPVNPEFAERIPQRPLGELSDFVVEELPDALTEIRSGKGSVSTLVDHADALVTSMDQDVVMRLLDQKSVAGIAGYSRFNHHGDLAGLDVKMLEAGIVHSGGEPSPRLSEAVSLFSITNDQPAVITYEEIIMGNEYGNPVKDPRLFTAGDVGQAETDFYRGHAHIDKNVRAITNQVGYAQFALETHGENGLERAAQELTRATTVMKTALADLDAFRTNLSPEDFNVFRQYLGTHPIRNLKGPSGAFTETIPVLDLQLAGEMMADQHKEYLQANLMYFPRKGRREIMHGIREAEKGNSLMSVYKKIGEPSELTQPIKDILDFVRSFRGRHYKTVQTQVPGALTGDIAGTGGEIHPRTFLMDRITETKNIRQTLKGEDQ